MASSTRTAQSQEAAVRPYRLASGPAHGVAGRPAAANLVTASNALAEAVVALLSETGVEAVVHRPAVRSPGPGHRPPGR